VTLKESLRAIADARRQDVVRYVRDPKSGLQRHVMILVVLVAAFWVARHRVRIRAARDVGATLGPAVLDRPYAAALLVTLLIASSPNGGAPQSLRNLFLIFSLAPVLLLTRPALDTRLVPAVFTVVVLFTLDRLRHAVGGVPHARAR